MTTPTVKIGLTAAEWKSRYANILRQFPDTPPAERRPMFPMGELEYAISHPAPYQTISVGFPSDPQAALYAIRAHIAGLDQ